MITLRESTKNFTKEHRGATQEQMLEAIGGAIQELAGNQHEIGRMIRDLGAQAQQNSERQIAESHKMVKEVMQEVRSWQKHVDNKLVDIYYCRLSHGKILEEFESHLKNDKPVEHVLNERLGRWLIGILGTLAGGAVMWAASVALKSFGSN